MLCFGYYPDGARPSPRPRFGRQYIVFDERYRQLDDAELWAMMADHEARFQAGTISSDAENYGQ